MTHDKGCTMNAFLDLYLEPGPKEMTHYKGCCFVVPGPNRVLDQ